MFTNRCQGVIIQPDPQQAAGLSVPFTRGDGSYCGSPIGNEIKFGATGCVQGYNLGSGAVINCKNHGARVTEELVTEMVDAGNASALVSGLDPLCPGAAVATQDVSEPQYLFMDDEGRPTDFAGWQAAVARMDEAMAEMGESAYYLHQQTGIHPDNMIFESSARPLAVGTSFATVYSGTARCTGTNVAEVSQPNKCYTTGNAASFQLFDLPDNCIIEIFPTTTNCERREATVAAVGGSPQTCFTGMNFQSIRAACVQK